MIIEKGENGYYGVVVTYITSPLQPGNSPEYHQVAIDLTHNFDTIDGWNEMMSKLPHQGKDVVIIYTHVLG